MAARQITNKKNKKEWWVDFYLTVDGARRRIRKRSPVQTKRGATEFEHTLRGELTREAELRSQPKQATFAEFAEVFLDDYARTNNKPSEVTSKDGILRNHLLPVFGERQLRDIGTQDIEAFKREAQTNVSAKTVNNVLVVLGKMLKVAHQWGYLSEVPRVKKLKAAKPVRPYFSFEQADRFIEAAKLEDPAKGYGNLLMVGLRTGLRMGELRGLRWQDVDFSADVICVQHAFARAEFGTTKSYEARRVTLSPDTRRWLEEQLSVTRSLGFGKPSYWVWPRPDGGPMTETRLKKAMKRVMQRAGLSHKGGLHLLRHTFASHLAMRGVSAPKIQKLMGHQDLRTTQGYMHLAEDSLAEAVGTLDQKMVEGAPSMNLEQFSGASEQYLRWVKHHVRQKQKEWGPMTSPALKKLLAIQKPALESAKI